MTPLFGAWSFFMVHIWFTPSEGPMNHENYYFSNSDHGSRPTQNKPLTWDDFMVHSVNRPLVGPQVSVDCCTWSRLEDSEVINF